MYKARIAGVGTLVVVVVALIAVLYFGRTDQITATEISTLAQQNKQSVVDGVANGQLLYVKFEEYRRNRPGPIEYPDTVITETWLGQGENGSIDPYVSTVRTLDGVLLQHGRVQDGVSVITDVATGRTFTMNTGNGQTLSSWLDEVWDRPQLIQDSDAEFIGQGSLNQRQSQVYEKSFTFEGGPDAGMQMAMIKRIELIEDAPLLLKQSLYDVDSQGTKSLVEESNLVEYKLLPSGSTVPPVQ